MARSFDGSGDDVRVAGGAAGGSGYGTFAAILKRGANGALQAVIGLGVNDRQHTRIAFSLHTNDQIIWDGDVFAQSGSGLTITTTDGWVFICAAKATGTATTSYWKYSYSGDSWTTSTSSESVGNWSTDTDEAYLGGYFDTIFGTSPVDVFTGDLAIAAHWKNRVLTDAEIRLLPFTLLAWLAATPSALWLLDQAATTINVPDLTGGGANQTAVDGTAVSTSSVPLFSYGASALVAIPAVAVSVTATISGYVRGLESLSANVAAYVAVESAENPTRLALARRLPRFPTQRQR